MTSANEHLIRLLEADEAGRTRLAVARDTLRGQQRDAFEFLQALDKRHGLIGLVVGVRDLGTGLLGLEWDGIAAPPIPVGVDVYTSDPSRAKRNITTACTLEGSQLRGQEAELDAIQAGDVVFLTPGEAARLVRFAEPVLLWRHPEVVGR